MATWALGGMERQGLAAAVHCGSCGCAAHLFKADVGDIPQDTFDGVCPVPLTHRVLLRPDDVEVVWDVICGVVPRLPLALALEPGFDVGGRSGISCGSAETPLTPGRRYPLQSNSPNMRMSLPMFHVPINTEIMSGSGFSECLFFIC